MPYLVCTPYSSTTVQPTQFDVTLDNQTTPITSAPQTVTGGVRLHYDVSAVAGGTHRATIKAVRLDPVWGRLESPASSPFDFTKPGSANAPTGLALEA
jgi:hypothetical protein